MRSSDDRPGGSDLAESIALRTTSSVFSSHPTPPFVAGSDTSSTATLATFRYVKNLRPDPETGFVRPSRRPAPIARVPDGIKDRFERERRANAQRFIRQIIRELGLDK
jgi:hypothetical protein